MEKRKAGRPKKEETQQTDLRVELGKFLDKNALKVTKEYLSSDEVSIEKRGAFMTTILPYVIPKKTEDKKEIPDDLKFVTIIIKGYKPDEDPFKDDDKEKE